MCFQCWTQSHGQQKAPAGWDLTENEAVRRIKGAEILISRLHMLSSSLLHFFFLYKGVSYRNNNNNKKQADKQNLHLYARHSSDNVSVKISPATGSLQMLSSFSPLYQVETGLTRGPVSEFLVHAHRKRGIKILITLKTPWVSTLLSSLSCLWRRKGSTARVAQCPERALRK